jgi:hypothetical protein
MSENEQNELDDMKHMLENLWVKYENEPNVKSKLISHMHQQLPSLLDNTFQHIIEKKTKKKQYIDLCREFTEEFLDNNLLFYLSSCEQFVRYNNTDYELISEDDLLHDILVSLNKRHEYSEYKQKIKSVVVKQIKEQPITVSIPESATIQSVLAILDFDIFPTKQDAKYFLTIIGDNILKKNDSIVHIINSNIKPFFTQLSELLSAYLGNSNGISSFKYKYHDQNYNKTRLLKTAARINNNITYSVNLPKYFLNLIAVACHYSSRYDNSDEFVIKSIRDHTLRDYIFFLKDNTSEQITQFFINDMLSVNNETGTDSCKISMKNILYLWKLYLERNYLPNIMFINTFKSELKLKLVYIEESEQFLNVTSKYLPFVSSFLQFWEDSIEMTGENEGQDYELDEIAQLFKKFCEDKSVAVSMTDDSILNAIQHFFPNIIVNSDKFISNIKCIQWNKHNEIDKCICSFKEHCRITDQTKSQSINTIYKFYCKELPKNSLVVSKQFFESYVIQNAHEHIINIKFIKSSWWN